MGCCILGRGTGRHDSSYLLLFGGVLRIGKVDKIGRVRVIDSHERYQHGGHDRPSLYFLTAMTLCLARSESKA